MNILWILEDALRAANMGCYGYPKETTPNCDALARDGVRFETCIATASHTLPPIVSMIMGQTTATHSIANSKQFVKWREHGLWEGATTPLHVLAEQGYLIDGELVTRWTPLGFTRDTAPEDFEDYFERNRDAKWFFYAEPYPTHLPYNPPEEYVRLFLDPECEPSAGTLERCEVVRNFMIVHPSGVISKLEAGEDDPLPDEEMDEAHKRTAGMVDLLPEDRPYVEALYDGEVRVFDDMVGCWVRKLEELGVLDDTLVIVTADHGEELMERGHVGHCSCNLKGTLYDEALRVPLIMRCPQKLPAGKVVKQQVSHIDIMPTVFELLGLSMPGEVDGASLLPLINGETEEFREEAYAETTPAGWQAVEADDREIWGVRTPDWKLILNTDARRSSESYELYDLRSDPDERNNLYSDVHEIGRRLRAKLAGFVDAARSRR